jgi:hypothetical protein
MKCQNFFRPYGADERQQGSVSGAAGLFIPRSSAGGRPESQEIISFKIATCARIASPKGTADNSKG